MRDRVKNLTISGRCLAGKKERKERKKEEGDKIYKEND